MLSSQEEEEPQSFNQVLAYVKRKYNVDFSHYGLPFLSRRIHTRMRARSVTDHEAYLALLREDRDRAEYAALLDALSINVSKFMRDETAFDALRQQALVPLVRERHHTQGRRLSIWSAGCSRGEEPYSVAILLVDLLGAGRGQWTLTLHATDVSARALAEARRGAYTRESFRDPSAAYVGRYFRQEGLGYHVAPQIREMVTWVQSDIEAPPLLAKYDVILCRNVLIYYVHDTQASIVSHLVDHLAPGGYLMLGMAEMLPPSQQHRLTPIDARARLYRLSSAAG